MTCCRPAPSGIWLQEVADSSLRWTVGSRRCSPSVEHSRLVVLLKLSVTVRNKWRLLLLFGLWESIDINWIITHKRCVRTVWCSCVAGLAIIGLNNVTLLDSMRASVPLIKYEKGTYSVPKVCQILLKSMQVSGIVKVQTCTVSKNFVPFPSLCWDQIVYRYHRAAKMHTWHIGNCSANESVRLHKKAKQRDNMLTVNVMESYCMNVKLSSNVRQLKHNYNNWSRKHKIVSWYL